MIKYTNVKIQYIIKKEKNYYVGYCPYIKPVYFVDKDIKKLESKMKDAIDLIVRKRSYDHG